MWQEMVLCICLVMTRIIANALAISIFNFIEGVIIMRSEFPWIFVTFASATNIISARFWFDFYEPCFKTFGKLNILSASARHGYTHFLTAQRSINMLQYCWLK